ncbi:MAG: LemA family protein [Clostridiales bacterium]|nr:LemA family protein [Clostridiales bacterium]
MQFLSLSTGAIVGISVGVGAVVLLLIIYFIWYVTTKNGLISLRNDMEESYSAMDVHMKKRYDLIPNLVETCKGYAKFEQSTLTGITQARNVAIAASPENKAAAESALNSQLHTLFNVVHEKYPELKANTQFTNLTRQLENCEHEIANSRKYYNAKVKILNNKIEKFPSSSVARKMGLERKPYFEIEDISERNAPRVSFDDAPRARL